MNGTSGAKRAEGGGDAPVSEHFRRREFECPCCGGLRLSPELIRRLEALRAAWGRPVRITSGYRCAPHNRAVGGVPNSRHLRGRAADLACPAPELGRLAALARAAGFVEIRPHPERGFLHLGV